MSATRVLVVDDDKRWRRAYKRKLEKHGYDVTVAADCETALRELELFCYPVVVVDMRLIGDWDSEGLRLVNEIDRLCFSDSIHKVIVSGYPLNPDEVQQLTQTVKSGSVSYLSKGGGPDKLIEELDRISSPVHYNVATIRNLVRAAFTDRDLRRFCQDRPLFQPVLSHCSSGSSLEDMIDVVIEYCQKRLLFPTLLLEIQRYNPLQYERHRSRLYDAQTSPSKATGSHAGSSIIPEEMAQVTVLLEGSLREFTPVRQREFVLALSRIVNTEPDRIRILRVSAGSILVMIEMPQEAAYLLASMCLAGEPILQALHITKVELSERREMAQKYNVERSPNLVDWLVDTLDLLRHNASNVLVERWEKRNLSRAVTPPVFDNKPRTREDLRSALPSEAMILEKIKNYQKENGTTVVVTAGHVESLRKQITSAQGSVDRYNEKLSEPLAAGEIVALEYQRDRYQRKIDQAVEDLADILAFLVGS